MTLAENIQKAMKRQARHRELFLFKTNEAGYRQDPRQMAHLSMMV